MAMMVGMGTTVFAEEFGGKEAISTDISVEELWQKAILQNQNLLCSKLNDEILELSITELIELREDACGNVEKDYSKTTLSLIDDNGEKMDLRTVLGNGNTSNSITEYGITVAGTIYYTAKMDSLSQIVFRVNSVVTSVIKGSISGVYPVSGNTLLWFSLDTADTNYFYKSFSCQSSVTSQSFTMPVSDRNYYPSMVDYVHINAQSVVNLSNGYEIVQNTSLIVE